MLFVGMRMELKYIFNRYLDKKTFVKVSLKLPIISFTFDDFFSSSYKEAGKQVLEKYNIHATYYASFGLMDTIDITGQQRFSINDLNGAIMGGHEIGGHTFSHLSCEEVSPLEYQTDILKNKETAKKLLGGYELKNFAYPHGKVSSNHKKKIFKYFKSLRGTQPGINVGWVDFGNLRSNELYGNNINLSSVKKLISKNKQKKGWLIFHAHEVCDNPSPWGCSLEYFEHVVKLVVQSKIRILTVDQAVDQILENH